MSKETTHGFKCGNAVFNKLTVNSWKKIELFSAGSGNCAVSYNGCTIAPCSTSWNMRASSWLCSLNPLLWSVSVSTKNVSWTMLRKNCWKKALLTAGSAALAKLLTISMHTGLRQHGERKITQVHVLNKPISEMSRIVCLIAQMTLSMNNLNCGGGMVRRARATLISVRIAPFSDSTYQGSSSG